ncbi:hypothetical protein [uncultured Gordonia sp.]|uniref:hypothetical protein n=1 Tax=uncultured Gordonia sp. TaxID=198437 RepID=UPI000FA342E8|nr:hypothetical protein [uncultured Gordonia sp.]RUP37848.1 MAG: hypothetical protein EKK60_11095 [Gordonia sp. (in: high G+C Gram-positive bacteria)]
MTATTRSGAAADRQAAADDRRRLVLLALGSLVVVALLCLAAAQWSAWRAADERQAQRDAVRDAAPTVIAGVLSYTSKTVAIDSRRARAMVTDRFAAANEPLLSVRREGAATVKARTVGVGESGEDWADVVAVVEIADPGAKIPPDDRILASRFVYRGGSWLLDFLEVIR